MSVQVSYKKQFVLGLVLIIIFLSVIEGIIRIYEINNAGCNLWGKDAFEDIADENFQKQICLDIRELKHEKPSILVYAPDQHYQTLNINSFGFRGPEMNIEKPDDVFRIFLIGGSTAMSLGSTSDKTTISGYLQNLFDDEQLIKNVEVINAGIGAADSFLESYYVKNMLVEFDPDLFIIYDGANDARYRILGTQSDGKSENDNNFIIWQDLVRDLKQYRTPFVIYDQFYRNIQPPAEENFLDEISTTWKNRWQEICKLGNEKGFSVLVTVQPILGTGEKFMSQNEVEIFGDNEDTKASLRVLEKMAKSLPELDKNCSMTADMRNVFDNSQNSIYFDDVHVTDPGNMIIAKKLFELSLPLVR